MNYILFMEHWREIAPTFIPKSYKPVPLGSEIDIGNEFSGIPVFFHFTNPSCECASNVKGKVVSLIKKNKNKIQFVIALGTEEEEEFLEEKKEWQKLLGELANVVTIIDDRNGELARKFGVISTPQAGILDKNHKLFYRGNYSTARYDIKNKNNMAEEALEGFLSERDYKEFAKERKAIGCIIPSIEKE